MINIEKVIRKMKQSKSVFTSEEELRREMALAIKELYPKYTIRTEYYPLYSPEIQIDILIATESGWIPIMLRYMLKAFEIHIDENKTVFVADDRRDTGWYHYVNNIEQLREMRSVLPEFLEGYAIVLTNDNDAAKPIELHENYEIHWEEYSRVYDGIGGLYYIAVSTVM